MLPTDEQSPSNENYRPVTAADLFANAHPEITRIVANLGDRAPDDYGAIRFSVSGAFHVRVHPSNALRALAIVDSLVKACEEREFGLCHDTPRFHSHRASAFGIGIDGEAVAVSIDERMRRIPYRLTTKELAQRQRGHNIFTPAYTYRSSGELTLKIGSQSCAGLRTVWKDRPSHALETQLDDVMVNVQAFAETKKADRLREAERRQRHAHIQHTREEIRKQIEAEHEAFAQLKADAEAWQQAETIRAYITAIEAQSIQRGQDKEHTAWALWARNQADRIDPLIPSPPSILDTPKEKIRAFDYWEMPDD